MNEFEERKEDIAGEEQPEMPVAEAAEEEAQAQEPAPEPVAEDAEADGTRPSAEEEVSEEAPAAEPEPDPQPEPEEPKQRMFTQDEVNAIISKRVSETKERAYKEGQESALRELLGKWGVSAEDELDALFGDGQRYPSLNEEYRTAQKDLTDLRGENALLKVGIPAEKWDDVKAIVAYQGGELSEDTISQLLETHPEWQSKPAKAPAEGVEYGTPEKPIVAKPVESIGRERVPSNESPEERERDEAMRYLGL